MRALNDEIRPLCQDSVIDRHADHEALVVGNTTMRDLFFGIDVPPIGQRPYKSRIELERLAGERSTTALVERAHRVGLWMHPRARFVARPCWRATSAPTSRRIW